VKTSSSSRDPLALLLAGVTLMLMVACASAPTSLPMPPPATVAPLPDTRVHVYPAAGQSEARLDRDRYECHRWASSQSGFDPTQPLGGAAAAEAEARRADYMRAQKTCLEGRGYSVN